MWFRRAHVVECGGFDSALHFYLDMEMILRYLALFPRVTYSNAVTAMFRVHPSSKSVAHHPRFFGEYRRTLEKLADEPGFESLHRPCRRRLEELDRHAELTRLLADATRPRWRRALTLAGLALRRPRPGLLRISAAGLRRLVLGLPWIAVGE
jgi:hypothetical protein